MIVSRVTKAMVSKVNVKTWMNAISIRTLVMMKVRAPRIVRASL